MKTIQENAHTKKVNKRPAKRNPRKIEELQTDPPISEKDEVKNAEKRLQNNSK